MPERNEQDREVPETAQQQDMRHPSTKALFAYWTRLKGNRPAPMRGEIDPRALAAHLGDILLLDSADQAHALRLAGSRMEAELGAPLVGTPFGALFNDETRREALQVLSIAAIEGEPVLLGVQLETEQLDVLSDQARPDAGQWVRPHWANQRWPDVPNGQQERRLGKPGSGELLLLPLQHRGKLGSRILGAFGLNTPSRHLPAKRIELKLVSQRILGQGAMMTTGPGLSSGTTLVARGGIIELFRTQVPMPAPQNDI